MMKWIDELPWTVVGLLCLSLGLAPFAPPHVIEKIYMLLDARLSRPIDWFDLALHSAPWALLVLKSVRSIGR